MERLWVLILQMEFGSQVFLVVAVSISNQLTPVSLFVLCVSWGDCFYLARVAVGIKDYVCSYGVVATESDVLGQCKAGWGLHTASVPVMSIPVPALCSTFWGKSVMGPQEGPLHHWECVCEPGCYRSLGGKRQVVERAVWKIWRGAGSRALTASVGPHIGLPLCWRGVFHFLGRGMTSGSPFSYPENGILILAFRVIGPEQSFSAPRGRTSSALRAAAQDLGQPEAQLFLLV